LENFRAIKFLSIDPGVNRSALAAWDKNKRLLYADNLETGAVSDILDELPAGVDVWVEVPIKYATKRKQHYQIGRLLEVANAFKAATGGVGVAPSAWKAQIPKSVHKSRILGNLDPGEFRAIVSPADHNTLDAIGIGLWALGRSGRGGGK
jgi:hypothetical protein